MNLFDRIQGLLLWTLVYEWWGSLFLALLVVGILVVVRRTVRTSYGPDQRRLALAGGLGILLAWFFVNALGYFSFAPFQVRWWVAVAPVLVATVAVVVALLRARPDARPEVPVTPLARRGWLSFTRRRDSITGMIVLAALVVTVIAAGAASAPDDNGWYAIILIPVGDQGAGSATFFGWAYGLPLLAAVVVLAAALAWALHRDAARPFLRPDTVAAETAARRSTSAVLFSLAVPAALLGLASAVHMVADAGLGSVGVGIPGVGNFNYSTGYAAFAPAMMWLSGGLRVWAIVWLLLAILGRRVGARSSS